MVTHPHCFHECLLVGTCQHCLSNRAVSAETSCCSPSTTDPNSCQWARMPKSFRCNSALLELFVFLQLQKGPGQKMRWVSGGLRGWFLRKGRYVGKYCRITVLFVPCQMDKFRFLRGQAVGLLHFVLKMQLPACTLKACSVSPLIHEQLLGNDLILCFSGQHILK